MTHIKGWHFAAADRRLGHGDGRLIVVGETLRVNRVLELHKRGLHYSRRIIDALTHGSGPTVCRVEAWGDDTITGGNRCCSTYRKTLWMLNATNILHEFACRCAEDALQAAGVTDDMCGNPIETSRRWLRGEATDEELSTASFAARSAAYHAARPAVYSATRFAAYTAAQIAAYSEEDDTACSAADESVEYATEACSIADYADYAVSVKFNRRLTGMVVAEQRRLSNLGEGKEIERLTRLHM